MRISKKLSGTPTTVLQQPSKLSGPALTRATRDSGDSGDSAAPRRRRRRRRRRRGWGGTGPRWRAAFPGSRRCAGAPAPHPLASAGPPRPLIHARASATLRVPQPAGAGERASVGGGEGDAAAILAPRRAREGLVQPALGGPAPRRDTGSRAPRSQFRRPVLAPSFGAQSLAPSFGAQSRHPVFGAQFSGPVFGARSLAPRAASPHSSPQRLGHYPARPPGRVASGRVQTARPAQFTPGFKAPLSQ